MPSILWSLSLAPNPLDRIPTPQVPAAPWATSWQVGIRKQGTGGRTEEGGTRASRGRIGEATQLRSKRKWATPKERRLHGLKDIETLHGIIIIWEVENLLFVKESHLPRGHAIHFHVSEVTMFLNPFISQSLSSRGLAISDGYKGGSRERCFFPSQNML